MGILQIIGGGKGWKILLLWCAVILTLFSLEWIFRTAFYFRKARAMDDPSIGWVPSPFIQRDDQGLRVDGKEYPVHFSTGKNGFRCWDSSPGTKKRLWVVGDSYTEAVQVSTDRAYYGRLKDRLPPEWGLYACGMGGYGTLQEFLLLERYWSEIAPDLVVWQWCDNDFCNNLYELENYSHENYSVKGRPFLEKGERVMRYPHETFFLSRHSHLWQWLAPKVFAPRHAGRDDPEWVATHFPASLEVTDSILGRARILFGGKPVLAFSVGGDPRCTDAFKQLAEKHGFHFVGNFNDQMQGAEKSGVVIGAHESKGGHWSEEGHAVAADILWEYLKPLILSSKSEN